MNSTPSTTSQYNEWGNSLNNPQKQTWMPFSIYSNNNAWIAKCIKTEHSWAWSFHALKTMFHSNYNSIHKIPYWYTCVYLSDISSYCFKHASNKNNHMVVNVSRGQNVVMTTDESSEFCPDFTDHIWWYILLLLFILKFVKKIRIY